MVACLGEHFELLQTITAKKANLYIFNHLANIEFRSFIFVADVLLNYNLPLIIGQISIIHNIR